MALAGMCGQMDRSTVDITRMKRRMDLVFSDGLMAGCTRDSGATASSVDKAGTPPRTARRRPHFGRMVGGRDSDE